MTDSQWESSLGVMQEMVDGRPVTFFTNLRRKAISPHANPAVGDVSGNGINLTSPAERFQRAVEAGPLTPAERTAFRSQLAQVVAQDEMKRAEVSPQLELAA